MESLARAYSGKVDFYILYVREAHPARNYPAHKSLSDKVQYAKDLKRLDNVDTRRTLIDDLEGTMHRDYGDRPNSVYIIGKDGVILYRADWSEAEEVETQLNRLLETDGYASGLEAVSLTDNFTAPTPEAARALYRVFKRAGWGAFVDFWFSSSALAEGRVRKPRAINRVPPQQDISMRHP